ncbi:MAG: tetratricopeptide repeat protein [Spirulinaceae cyanobacterium RM2_2_10]|nr:tetratricopeptide repeat protein [Spirulinaceae cyanobacterium RM2_2_10]
MLKSTWRWLRELATELLGNPTSVPHPTEIPPLTNEGYESLLRELLTGLANGWGRERALNVLGVRRYDPWFVSWLQRHGRQLLRQSPLPSDRATAEQMIALGRLEVGELSATARGYGERLLAACEAAANTTPQPVRVVESDDPLALFEQANEQYQAGKLDGALALWEQTLALQPDFGAAYNGCGAALYYLGRCDEAIAQFERAIELQAEVHLAHFNRGHAYLALGELDAALDDFSLAMERQPNFHPAYHGRGLVWHRLGRYREAIADFSQAADLEPTYHFAYNGRGIVQAELGNHSEALADFSLALRYQPNVADLYLNRGNTLRALGRYQEALTDFNQCLLVEPSFYHAYYSRGNTQADLGEYELAIADYKEALAQQPNYPAAYNGRGTALRYLGRYNDAIADYNAAIYTKDDFWQAWANRGWAIFQSPPPLGADAAIQNWEEGLGKLDPDAPDYAEACGTMHYYKGQAAEQVASDRDNPRQYYEQAIRSYQSALDALQDSPGLEERYLEVMQHLIAAYTQIGSDLNTKNLLNIATLLLKQILLKAGDPARQLAIAQKFIGLQQLRVDQLAKSVDARQRRQAVEVAEEGKNLCLRWWRDRRYSEATAPTLDYAQIQKLLTANTSVIYWHISPAAITTFVLQADQPPQSLSSTRHFPDPRLRRWQAWLEQWQSEPPQAPDGDLAPRLQALAEILDSREILSRIPATVEQLILIPHRELHWLPLHALFSPPLSEREFRIAYLPSARFGLDLDISLPAPAYTQPQQPLLSVAHPDGYTPHNAVTLAAIARLFPHRQINSEDASQEKLLQALKTPANIFHFSGECQQHASEPERSAWQLANGEQLTLTDFLAQDIPNVSLLCLPNCHW